MRTNTSRLMISLLVAGACLSAFSVPEPFDGGVPLQFSIAPTAPVAGQQITLTVVLEESHPQTIVIPISSTTPAKFSSLPSSIAVPAGSTTACGTATIASNATGQIAIAAGSNNEQIVSVAEIGNGR